ncbi:MAG: DoxX family membrane protein [Bacteroidia bacterium]
MKAFIPTSVSRSMYAIMLGMFGVFHLMSANDMAGMVPSFIPGGVFWVYLVGIALILACISIIWGKKARLAAYLTGIMLVIFTLTIYLPQMMNGDEMAMPLLLKEIALAGAAFFIGNHMED